jgi:predicted 3-demethylubiquinone-9 3-methyltransferase (glyoxalase superfamily)
MTKLQKISPCLWFDDQAEEAAAFYVSLFDRSRILQVVPYAENTQEITGKASGTVMTVLFELDGQQFTALNGGPMFKFSEALSLQIACGSQSEIDHFWSRLSEGGTTGPCGWLKDRYGVSWQVFPESLPEMLADADKQRVQRVTRAFMQMTKFDIAALERAYHANEATVG